MIEDKFFASFPFPCYLFDKGDSDLLIHKGSLFEAPSITSNRDSLAFYRSAPVGWSKCPHGFAIYKQTINSGNKWTIVLYGLKVAGISTAHGKSASLSIKTDRGTIQQYLESALYSLNGCNDHVTQMLSSNIHEIRNINANMYNTIVGLISDESNKEEPDDHHLVILKNLESLSEILKIRTDYTDVISGTAISNLFGEKIPVYKKFDRVRKSLTPSAKQKRIPLRFDGASHSYISGMKLFEVIPYIVLHNAIKYSPPDTPVDISIRETDDEIIAICQSVGPILNEFEKKKVFDIGFRGSNAKAISSEGSGIGLFYLKRLVDSLGASVELYQENAPVVVRNGIGFCKTSFILRFKIKEKVETADEFLTDLSLLATA